MDRKENTVSNNTPIVLFTDPLLRNGLFYCCVRIRSPGNVFTEPLPRNGRLLWLNAYDFRASYHSIIAEEITFYSDNQKTIVPC
jgi:hypothetical protein